jgi:hypothetical protein
VAGTISLAEDLDMFGAEFGQRHLSQRGDFLSNV